MCGRYVSPAEAAIEREWHVGSPNSNPFPQRFNVAPTTVVPILGIGQSGELALMMARWGLIPHWWKEAKPPRFTFNARSEEIMAADMWRQPMRSARCLVPALGWYEWQAAARIDPATGEVIKVKQPRFIHRREGGLLCFAGLMSTWQPAGQSEPVLSCSILTKSASGSVAAVHERMPVVLPADAHAAWVDAASTDAARACELVRERAIDDFEHYPVSVAVNSVKNDDARLIEAAEPAASVRSTEDEKPAPGHMNDLFG